MGLPNDVPFNVVPYVSVVEVWDCAVQFLAITVAFTSVTRAVTGTGLLKVQFGVHTPAVPALQLYVNRVFG